MLPARHVPSAVNSSAELPGALGRNAACHQCRKRKRKCDATRPICTPCRNPLRRKPGREECTWDDTSPPQADALTATLEAAPVAPPPESDQVKELEDRRARLARRVEGTDVWPERPHVEGQEDRFKKRRMDEEMTGAYQTDTYGVGSIPPETTDLIWPDWPLDLPAPNVVEHIIGVFFDKVPMVPRMMRRQTVLSNLALPPSHPAAPARSLLHAIIAISANYLPPSAGSSRLFAPVRSSPLGTAYYGEWDPIQSAFPPHQGNNVEYQDFHRRKALERLAEQSEKFAQLIPSLQTQILIAQMDLVNAKSIPYWQEAGACVRMAVPLLLNESPNRPDHAFNRFLYLSLPPAQSDMEQAERDRTWWMAWLIDRQCTTPGFWPVALDDSSVTVELPVAQHIFESGQGELTGCQTLHSPDLFDDHPFRHSDSFVMLIKAMKLNANIAAFFRTYARGAHSLEAYTSHPVLEQLKGQILAMRRSFPAHLRTPTGGAHMDPEHLATVWLINGADVVLGEPLIPEDWTCELAVSALAGIRGSLSLLYDIYATSYDITLLSQICLNAWFTCSRALCRFIEAATLAGDLTSAALFSGEVQVFRRAISLYGDKVQIGIRQLRRIDALLEAQQQAVDVSHTLAFDVAKETAHPRNKPTIFQNTPRATSRSTSSSLNTPVMGNDVQSGEREAADWAAAWVHSSNFSFETMGK